MAMAAVNGLKDPFVTPAKAEQLKKIMADATAELTKRPGADVIQPAQTQPPQGQAQQRQAIMQPDTDGDGEPGAKAEVDAAMRIVNKGWNRENVKNVTDPAQRTLIEDALTMAEEVARFKKAKIRGTVESAMSSQVTQ
jgi:hypothetical protein